MYLAKIGTAPWVNFGGLSALRYRVAAERSLDLRMVAVLALPV